jgi:sugar phosphate isomerase/epimerase
MNRRRFLGRAACLSTAAVTLGTSPAVAIPPVQRNGVSKFKFSLAAYSYRNLLTGKDAKLTLADFVDDCARMQLEGTEPTSYYFPDPVTPEYLRALKQQCFRLGLAISGTAIRNDFGHPPGQQRQQEIEHTKRWIEYAETLGAPVIRIFAGYVKEGSSAEEAHRLIVSGLEECCEHAGRHGVYLALENHGGPTATADGLLALVRDVQSPWFGVTLDTGNFRGEDVYGDLARIAPYALTVQVKVVVAGPNNRREPADFRRLARILKEVGYRGYIVLEYEEDGNPREACPSHIEQLRAAFAEV